MPSAREIRSQGVATMVPVLLPDPPSPLVVESPPPPVQPVELATAPEILEPVPPSWWEYLLYYLAMDALILVVIAIPIGLAMVSAWTHAVTFVLLALVSIITAREKTQTGSRWCAGKILTRSWALKLIVIVWWLCTLVISLSIERIW